MSMKLRTLMCKNFLLLLFCLVVSYKAYALNGFDLSQASIPIEEIHEGGPPKDGIPSIDKPQFESVIQANWLQADEMVIGVVYNGIAKAYPIRILNWHEIVNDEFAGEPLLVTYCPLCGTGIVFLPPQGGQFGVSGLLYNSDVLLYDRNTESLWSQILAQAVVGERLGEKLSIVPSRFIRWREWLRDYPKTLVLSRITGHNRDYSRDPYLGYDETPLVFFPVANKPDDTLYSKERVIGITLDGVAKAYPFSSLEKNDKEVFEDMVGDTKINVHWSKAGDSAWITDVDGNDLPIVDGFWFAWYAFHPDTLIFIE